MDSMRSELGGIYSIIQITALLASYYNVKAGKITIGSDCDTALYQTVLNQICSPSNRIRCKHADIINPINRMIEDSPIKHKGVEIDGHKDDLLPLHRLTWWEQRNVEMNELAKTYMQYIRDNNLPYQFTSHSPSEGYSVYINKTKISGNFIQMCHDTICGDKIKQYWTDKGRLSTR